MSNRPSRQKSRSARVSQARKQSQSNRMWLIGGIVGAAVLVALLVALTFGLQDDSSQQGTVAVEGGALAEMPRGGGDPAVGQGIPTVEGQSFDGTPITISADGKPKVVMLLAHWCPHCQAEVPRIQEWIDANGMPDDVELYAVSTGVNPGRDNYPPSAWLEREGWTVPTIADDDEGSAGSAFGLSGFPFFVVVDADGNVVTRTSGELSIEQWEALLESARTGTAPSTSGTAGPSSPR